MAELKATQRAIRPSDTLLVVDAMTGQEAASLTKAFNEAAELTGAVFAAVGGHNTCVFCFDVVLCVVGY